MGHQEGNAESAEYWSERPVTASGRVRRWARQQDGVARSVSWVYSTRRSDELFLAKAIRERRIRRVLDVACGPGKAILGRHCDTVGVDIAGAPFAEAKANGYHETFAYSGPTYEIPNIAPVDAVTVINLNAHVAPRDFMQILRNATQVLSPDGCILIIGEFDNDGMSYRGMRWATARGFDELVQKMGHFHLERERPFVERLRAELPEFDRVVRTPLVGSLVPFLQYYYAFARGEPRTAMERGVASVFDAIGGLCNRAQLAVSDAVGSSFIVAYVLTR